MVLLVFPNLSKITLFEWVIIIVIKLSTLISRNNTCTVNHWKSSTSCPGVNALPLLFRSPSWDWPLQSEWTWWTTRWNWDSPSHWDKTLTSQLRCSLFHFHVHLGDSYIIWNGWHILFFKLMSFFFQINSSGVCNVKYFKCSTADQILLSLLWWLFASGCSLGLLRNLASFFRLRCCGLVKPAIIDWTQQFPPGRPHSLGAHSDLVWPIMGLHKNPGPKAQSIIYCCCGRNRGRPRQQLPYAPHGPKGVKQESLMDTFL